MALTLTSIRLLARSHCRAPFDGPILTLGRQGILGSFEQCSAAVRSQGVTPLPVSADVPSGPNVPAFQGEAHSAFTNDIRLFSMMCGEPPATLDISDYENADYVHDLNLPIPDSLKNKFSIILDIGTMEHVFHVPQALANLNDMLKVGGRIIHINPVSNWAEHGFYQFSPTFYYDYYSTNGFEMNECLILEVKPSQLEGHYSGRNKAWRWNPNRPSAPIISGNLLSSYFEATKRAFLPSHVPQQGEAREGVSSSRLGGIQGNGGRLNRLRERVIGLTPAAAPIVKFGKRLLRRDLSSRPWGLDFAGRF